MEQEQQQQQQHPGTQSWILLDSDFQNQLLMRAPSVSPVGHPFESSSSPAAAVAQQGEDEEEEEQAREITPLLALPAPHTSIIPTNRDVRLILELAERSFESMDESSLRSSPVTTNNVNNHRVDDKYGGRGNPAAAAFRDLRPEMDVSVPRSVALPPSPVRNKIPMQPAGEDDDDEEYDTSFFTSHLVLLLSHAATLMVGYYIGSRVAATSSSSSSTTSSSSSSSSSSSCMHCSTMGSHLTTISSSIE